jgi:hypothetical protein
MKGGSLLKNCPPFVTNLNVGTVHENDEHCQTSLNVPTATATFVPKKIYVIEY